MLNLSRSLGGPHLELDRAIWQPGLSSWVMDKDDLAVRSGVRQTLASAKLLQLLESALAISIPGLEPAIANFLWYSDQVRVEPAYMNHGVDIG